MAWSEWQWRTESFKKDANFRVDVYWGFKQNKETRETMLAVNRSGYVVSQGANIGYPDASIIVAGVGWDASRLEKTYSGIKLRSPNYYTDATYTFDFGKSVFKTIKHDRNGVLTEKANLQMKALFKTYVGLAYSTDWVGRDISSKVPKMEKLVDPPKGGTLKVVEIKHNTAKLVYSGFSSQAGLNHYDVSVVEGDEPDWQTNGLNTEYRAINLKPETRYNAFVRAIDIYGQESLPVKTSFVTDSEQAITWINVNGAWKKAKVWINVNGNWKKVKKINVNVNGKWKKVKGA